MCDKNLKKLQYLLNADAVDATCRRLISSA
jgi:hypothetical protein